MQKHFTVFFDLDSEQGRYLKTCARIRDLSITRLTQILMNKIAEDQLTTAVLDDDGQHEHCKHERRFREVV